MSKKILIRLISFYQRLEPLRKSFFQTIGIQQSYVCVFYPSCSSYCKTSFEKYGIFKGFFKCVWRISRCHPWQKKHIDQV